MISYAKCPHCHSVVKSGHGAPWKRIGTPIKRCPRCYRNYIDNDVYEWSILGFGYKLWFYFFANNRFIPWFLLLITVPGTDSWLYFVIGSILWMIFCVLWVNITKKQEIMESEHRAAYNLEYIKMLSDGGYDKIAIKYDPFYTSTKETTRGTEEEIYMPSVEEHNPRLGNVTYDMVEHMAFEMGVPFETAQRIINYEREAAGVPPIHYEKKIIPQRYSGDIWDDPNVKINFRD